MPRSPDVLQRRTIVCTGCVLRPAALRGVPDITHGKYLAIFTDLGIVDSVFWNFCGMPQLPWYCVDHLGPLVVSAPMLSMLCQVALHFATFCFNEVNAEQHPPFGASIVSLSFSLPQHHGGLDSPAPCLPSGVQVVIVSDDVAAIAAEAHALSEAFELVITAGGVGPTPDDVTMAGIAAALGVPLTRDPTLEVTSCNPFQPHMFVSCLGSQRKHLSVLLA